ncbi:MAG: ABC transporter permease [Rhizobacter sp.]|nr:ABC transporter permease [Ferruginibacter sp.]
MFKNYFKTAWRFLNKSRFYSLINIGGLTVGLAVGILILFWVNDELSFDGFHKNAAGIYKLENMAGTGASRQIWTNTTGSIGPMVQKELPGVKAVVRTCHNGYFSQFRLADNIFNIEKGAFTDPSLFSVFDFNLVEGNDANPFPDINSVVLTQSIAKKYFGDKPALGRLLTTEDNTSFKVSGIIKDIPKNSSIDFEVFFPMNLLAKKFYADKGGSTIENDFHYFNFDTYLVMDKGIASADFENKIRNIHLRNKADDVDVAYMLQPLSKVHLYQSDGSDKGMSTVKMFAIIAIVILLIACINYVNLSTARSMLRAKEVSLRKIVGANRLQLFFQFIVETLIIFLIAGIVSVLLVYLLMPYFNQLSGKELVASVTDPQIWKVILIAITGTLIISSIYPALLLSSFDPLKALKGKLVFKMSETLFRKVLVISQFTFSVVLIAGTFVIAKQLNYIRNKNLGFDREHVFTAPMRDMRGHYDAVKADLLKQTGITAVTWSNSTITDIGQQTGNNSWDGKEEGETLMLSPMAIDKEFINFFKIGLQSGKNFSGSPADSGHFILNETAVKSARIQDPIGKRFKLWNTEGTIIGVVKDFHFSSMKEKIRPAIFYSQPGTWGQLYIKTNTAEASKAIAAVEKKWNLYNAGFPFKYAFLDERFNDLYKTEQRTGMLFNIFSGIAIFISCLGLFGLAAYTAQVRTREIGVRKVLGASVAGIIKLLAGDFVKLVLVAIIIGTPIAWFITNKWLQDFAYKINIGWLVFVLAGLMAMGIALLTISFQSIKAAIQNPVKSLRTE